MKAFKIGNQIIGRQYQVQGSVTVEGVPPLTLTDATAGTLSAWEIDGRSKQGNIVLPSGYTQLEYIQSSGTQYIDTGVILNCATDDVEVEFQLADSGQQNVFGARSSTSSSVYTFAVSNTNKWRVGWHSSTIETTSSDTNKHKLNVDHSNGEFSLDGTVLSTRGSSDIITPTTNTLFAIHAISGSSFYYGNTKMYSYKMWRSGVLTQHFIPAKNSSNVIGMYDTVTNTFFTNAGSGSFTAGGEISPTPTNPIDVKGVGKKTENLFDMHYDVGYTGSYPNITAVSGGKSTEWIETSQFDNYFYYVWNVNTKSASCVLGVIYSNDKSEILYRDGMINTSTASDINIDIPGGGGNPFSINHNYSYVKFYFINWQYVNHVGIYTTSKTTFIPYGYKVPILQANNCGVVDLGTLNWTKNTSYDTVRFLSNVVTDVKPPLNNSTPANIYSVEYNTYSTNALIAGSMDGVSFSNGYMFSIRDNNLSSLTAEQFKGKMNGIKVYYQRTSDDTWTPPTTTNINISAALQKIGTYTDIVKNDGTLTRGVGVKVLTGTESWQTYTYQSSPNAYYIIISDMIETSASTSSSLFMNTHLQYKSGMWASADIGYAVSSMNRVFFRRNTTDTVDAWKSWLASQYAAGTPVMIYYPLATATTEQITVPSISIGNGTNYIDTDTDVKPSSMSVTFSGGSATVTKVITMSE